MEGREKGTLLNIATILYSIYFNKGICLRVNQDFALYGNNFENLQDTYLSAMLLSFLFLVVVYTCTSR